MLIFVYWGLVVLPLQAGKGDKNFCIIHHPWMDARISRVGESRWKQQVLTVHLWVGRGNLHGQDAVALAVFFCDPAADASNEYAAVSSSGKPCTHCVSSWEYLDGSLGHCHWVGGEMYVRNPCFKPNIEVSRRFSHQPFVDNPTSG